MFVRTRVILSGLCVLGGCFVEATTAYMPAMKVSVAQGGAAPIEHTEGGATVVVNLGVYLDAFGVGLHYGFAGTTGVTGVAGLPERWGQTGWRVRGDKDLPVRFGPNNFFGLRATYQYQRLTKGEVGPSGDLVSEDVPAHGSGHLAGLTVIGPTSDVGLTLGVMHVSLDTDPDSRMTWPAFHADGTGLSASVIVRFIPTGALLKYYNPKPSEPQKLDCPNPSYSEHCETHSSGYTCTFTHGC